MSENFAIPITCYRFGRSHMYFGAVLTIYCLAIIAAKTHNGRISGSEFGGTILAIWAPSLVIVSLLFGPFWFTPFAFRTEVVQVGLRAGMRYSGTENLLLVARHA